jgi:hypothetical protein
MSQTFLQLKQKLRRELFPAGEAKNLQIPHDAYFVAAMIDIQRWVECLQVNNASQFAACDAYWENAKTVVEAPKGIVKRVFTVANDDWRDKVHYWSSNFNDMECWAKTLMLACPTPLNTGLTKLQQGFKFAEDSTDGSTTRSRLSGMASGRARTGIWAIYRKRLYVAPWLQSNEVLVVEWDGKKDDWIDTDIVNTKYWTPTVEEAIKLYVRYSHELYFGDKREGGILKQLYNEKISDLIFDCREETRQQEKQVCDNGEGETVTQAELDDDVPITETDSFVHAFVSDWGLAGVPLDDVEEQVVDLAPRVLILGGDNVYTAGQASAMIDRFSGLNKIYAWGNHDWSYAPGDLSALLALVANPGNERYFTYVDGLTQYFVLSTDSHEPDGGYVDATTTTEASIMGEWLRIMLAMSTAKFKVVIGHHSPYTSDVNNTPGNAWMRWPFALWGADLYIGGHGHNYEYAINGGLPYIVCGLGGHSIRGFGADTAGTQYQYNSDYAYLKLTASCDELAVDLVDRSGATIYTVTIPG